MVSWDQHETCVLWACQKFKAILTLWTLLQAFVASLGAPLALKCRKGPPLQPLVPRQPLPSRPHCSSLQVGFSWVWLKELQTVLAEWSTGNPPTFLDLPVGRQRCFLVDFISFFIYKAADLQFPGVKVFGQFVTLAPHLFCQEFHCPPTQQDDSVLLFAP